MHLFTPVGERGWVHGWAPRFPAGERGDGSAPGTVFVTEHDGAATIWVVVDRAPDRVRYARVTPGARAGTVEVRCLPAPDGGTNAEVTYEMTALRDGDRFDPAIADWDDAIAAALPAS
jgi:hypothetical protein